MGEELLTSEGQLIARARAGDREAFCALAGRYERRVYRLALHYCRDAHDAEDLSQEVWLRAFRSLPTFRGEASFYTWLRQLMINAFLNHRRGATLKGDDGAVRARHVGLDTLDEARARDGETALDERLLTGEVMRALAELAPRQRLVFLLKHQEGMTYEEIARALGCSAGTAKKALFRAVAKLRARLCVEAGAAEENLAPCHGEG